MDIRSKLFSMSSFFSAWTQWTAVEESSNWKDSDSNPNPLPSLGIYLFFFFNISVWKMQLKNILEFDQNHQWYQIVGKFLCTKILSLTVVLPRSVSRVSSYYQGLIEPVEQAADVAPELTTVWYVISAVCWCIMMTGAFLNQICLY